MVLVDTNIFVALMIQNTPWHGQATELFNRDLDWRSEAHALVELSNVLLRLVRVKEIGEAEALLKLREAQSQFSEGLLYLPHTEALSIAFHHHCSAYDARFLGAARALGIKLTTEDARLRKAAPKLTQSLVEALATA